MLLFFVAAQMSAPEPVNQERWFTPADVPVHHLTENELERVHYRLTVRPDGSLQSCEVEASTGNWRIDKLTCTLLERRARFRPASDSSGAPAYGVYRSSAHWVIVSGPPRSLTLAPTGDLKLTVNKLPDGVTPPALAQLQAEVDEKGHVTSCSEASGNEVPQLVQMACNHLVKLYEGTSAKSPEGVPVPSVQTVDVTFETEADQPIR